MADLHETFRNPPRTHSPVPIWWWSGERLNPERLRWQLERFAEGGVYNLIVLNLAPTGPLYGKDPDDPPFFSEEWWQIFRGACEDARQLGVYLWFYDQIGFSGANLQGELVKAQPQFSGQSIERVFQDADGPCTLECPAGGQPVAASAVPLDDQGVPAGQPVALEVRDGRAEWTSTGRHRVLLAYSVDRGFDYTSREACQTLLDTIHGQFEARVGEYFGNTIVGSFQDELPSMPLWSRTFAGEFQRRHGYDLLPRLAALWEDYGDEALRVRRDYHETRAVLVEEAFFKPLFQWHEDRGLLCGFDQQSPPRTGDPIGSVHLYADYLRTHRWYQAPGSDHHGEAKIHSSLAHLYDRPRVWIESFHSSGWGGTLEETFDWLLPWLRAGANLYDPHAVYYSTRGGWFEWAPPSTDWRQPYWKHYRHFSRAVSRLCAVLSLGHHVCDVGLLYPNATVQAGFALDGANAEAQAAHDAYTALVGDMRWYHTEVGLMDRSTVDYDVLDDDSVQRGQVSGAALRIGGESYGTVILPACTTVEAGTAAKLVELVQAGGRLIAIGAAPRLAAGMAGSDDEHVRELADLFGQGRAQLVATPEEVLPLLASGEQLVSSPVPTLVRQVDGATVVFVPARFPRATTMASEQGRGPEFSWVNIGYQFDPSKYSRLIPVKVRGMRGAPQVWEPFSGALRAVEYTEHPDGVEAKVPFADGPGVLLVWPGEAGTGDGLAPASVLDAPTSREEPLDDVWTVELEPTLDNRWGDFDRPASPNPMPVAQWTLKHAVGTSSEQLQA
ncbi:MAG: hypothetical protein M3281_08530, partial [Chloroflexota bacterium]|nr:hypothetical protein [Chloroflexota bacterium]